MIHRAWLFVSIAAIAACSSSSDGASTTGGTTAAGGAGTTTTAAGGAGGATTTSSVGGAGGATAAGGSGAGGGIPEGGLEACTAAWSKACKQLEACVPAWTETLFADEAACEKAMAEACAEAVFGPGRLSVAQMQTCAGSFEMADCASLFRYYEGGKLSEQCVVPGPGATNAPCATDFDCASGSCATAPGAACGKCAARVAEGKPCNAQKPCEWGLACAGTCKKYGAVGDACAANAPCHLELGCVEGKCVEPLADGAPCNPQAPARECELYHFCNVKKNVCEPLALAAVGEPCAIRPDGSIAACKVGGVCRIDDLATSAGTCVATVPSGGACSMKDAFLWNQGPCGYPETCVEGTCQGWAGHHCE